MFFQSVLSFHVLSAIAAVISPGQALPTGGANDADAMVAAISKRGDGQKFVQMGFNVVRNSLSDLNISSPARLMGSQDNTVPANIQNLLYHYNIDLEFGSDNQKITVSVDTGSADLWVVASDATCQKGADCMSQGTYDASGSSDSKNLNIPFSLTYVDQTTTSGTYYLDDVTLPGGITAENVQFASANTTSSSFGILGIGLNNSEAPIFGGDSNAKPYPNFPWALKNQGIIGKAAYSLYLSSPSAESGTLLFGGIDTAKVQGGLLKLPGAFPSRLGVQMDSISVAGNISNVSTGFVFDSGYSYSAWPQNIADAIGSALSGSSKSGNSWSADCSQPDQYITLVFGKGAKQINVPYSSFIAPNQSSSGTCSTTISYSSNGDNYNNLPTLGDDVLRSFYVVYDIEDNTLQIAQSVFTSSSNIEAIE